MMGSLRDLRRQSQEEIDTIIDTLPELYFIWCDTCKCEINLYDCDGGYYQDYMGSAYDCTYCPKCGNQINW